ncbi:MAG: hypothetical protein Kow006_15940 [Gammaproteobacteria bacterium]
MRIVQALFLLLVFVFALAFTVINADKVQLNYYLGSLDLPLSVIVIGAFALGMFTGLLALMGRLIRLKSEVSRLQRSERIAQQELTNLRSLPVKDESL